MSAIKRYAEIYPRPRDFLLAYGGIVAAIFLAGFATSFIICSVIL